MSTATAIPNLKGAVHFTLDEAKRQEYRKKCRESLYFLCKAVLGFRDFNSSVHLRASKFIQHQEAKRKLFMLPRSFFKSYLATIGYPIWLLIQEKDVPNGFYGPEERILIANATFENAAHFKGKIDSVFERNTTFQWLFPELIPDFSSKSLVWNKSESTIARPTDYPEPTLTAAGVGAALVSRHFTRIILDDLINEQHTESPELMRKAIAWYSLTESLLVETKRNEQLVIGTRWAYNDLYSHIEETEGEYDVNERPLGFAKHIRSAVENDKPIFPERFDFKELSRLKQKYGEYMYSCLYMNNPRGEGINDFSGDWLRYYTFDDRGRIVRDDGTVIDVNDLDRFSICDIATSVRKDADFSATVVFGISEFRDIFVLDAWHGKATTKNVADAFLKYATKWHCRTLYYEDSAAQRLIEYALTERIRQTGQYVRLDVVKPVRGKVKEERIRQVSRFFQTKRVHVRHSMQALIQEYLDFPLGKHDDLLDCVGYLPQAARFQYPEEDERDKVEDEKRRENEPYEEAEQLSVHEMNIMLQGRSIVTGY